MILSNSTYCGRHNKVNLLNHVKLIVSAFSFIPNNENSIRFIKSRTITNTLFELALESNEYSHIDLTKTIIDIIIDWGFKAENHTNGLGILEKSLYAVATITLKTNCITPEELNEKIYKILDVDGVISTDKKSDIASKVRNTSENLDYIPTNSSIEVEMCKIDMGLMEGLLHEISNKFS